MARAWFAFEEAERILDRIDQWPVELEQLFSCAERKNDYGHG